MWNMIAIWMTALTVATAGLPRSPHPRLWLPANSEGWLHEKIAGDPLAARLQDLALAEAERALAERTCRYELLDGKRLLPESRRALNTIMHCAWAWRSTGEEKYRLRTIAELEAACALKDWNPSHFLDIAEMATAVATGYDWLHPSLTPAQREMCEHAIVEKALKPARKIYADHSGWSKPRNNWSQVCGAGIALAAAAVAGNDEGLADDLFDRGLQLVESCEKFYQPDGMYPEGPGYWHYGTNFHVMLLAACGPLDQAITDPPILKKGGDAIMHLTGPTRGSFNFSDGSARTEKPSAAQCWLAVHYRDAAQARYVRGLFQRALDEGRQKVSVDRYFPLSILWLPEQPAKSSPLPKAAVFHGEQAMALFRSGWAANAAWLGIKGGTPAASHGQMDVGSFVYDAHDIRWIHDLGNDNYNLPSYFGSKRWDYLRLQNRSHSTLEIGGKLQNPRSKPCPLTSSSTTGNPLAATFDLSDAYEGSAGKVLRTARFQTDSGIVRIKDDINSPAGDVVWRAITKADCEVKGTEVILHQNGRQITLRRISNSGEWSVTDLKPPTAAEQQNKGFRAVVLTVPRANRVSLEVEIRP